MYLLQTSPTFSTSSSCFFTATPTPEIYTLSLHDALPISVRRVVVAELALGPDDPLGERGLGDEERPGDLRRRSEEHTSELSHSSISYAVFCLKKKKDRVYNCITTGDCLSDPRPNASIIIP